MSDIDNLKDIARQLRIDIISMIHAVQSGHPGGSLSACELVTALYFHAMRIDPANPDWEDRDRFVLSKGHGAPILYAALARKGFFPVEDLQRLRQVDSHLQGAQKMSTPGVDMSGGPLGQGLSAAVGMALAGRYMKKDYRTYCMIGDGELQEGQIWEAAMAAATFRLERLIAILDSNTVQMNGTIEQIMPLGDVAAKFRAFGWHVVQIDGHDMNQVVNAIDECRKPAKPGMPAIIIADTVKGKGVSYMEGNFAWHGAAPNDEQFQQALAELGAGK